MAQMRRIPSTGPEKADKYRVPVWNSSQLPVSVISELQAQTTYVEA